MSDAVKDSVSHPVTDAVSAQEETVTFPLKVELMSGRALNLDVALATTVDTLKTRIGEELGVLAAQQRLFCNSVELDTGSLLDAGVAVSDTLTLMLKEAPRTSDFEWTGQEEGMFCTEFFEESTGIHHAKFDFSAVLNMPDRVHVGVAREWREKRLESGITWLHWDGDVFVARDSVVPPFTKEGWVSGTEFATRRLADGTFVTDHAPLPRWTESQCPGVMVDTDKCELKFTLDDVDFVYKCPYVAGKVFACVMWTHKYSVDDGSAIRPSGKFQISVERKA